ncbi:hypothetical protein BSKO_09131 [Bryopsis sp. KO-2023]|nr:hypothetical protein BSKO_09131 [Bryopsis sp. KO-2023]
MEKVNQGNSSFVDEEYEDAVAHYTKALETLSGNADVYARRAQAHLQLDNHLDAAEDAGKAIELDPTLAKAYLRKGVACFHLDEFETARSYFTRGAALEPKKSIFKTWARKCDAEIADEMSDDDEILEAEAETKPSPPPVTTPPTASPPKEQEKPSPSPKPEAPTSSDQPIASAVPPRHDGKYRHQWYENQTHVYIQVFAKKMTDERVEVSMGDETCIVKTKSEQGDQDYELNLDLKSQIVPAESRYEVMSTKIEVKLKKANGRTWASLEKDEIAPKADSEKPAAYPSSYKKKVIDWNKLEQDVKSEEENDKLEGDAAVQKLFRQIYAGADEDTRRAMNKSFVESNGTVLSTNWSEVGSKEVECTPPSGMEPKKM